MTEEQWARLLAESLPTGEFGGPRPDAARGPRPVSTQQAARNYAELKAAVDELDAAARATPARSTRRRHLRAVPDPDQPDLGAA